MGIMDNEGHDPMGFGNVLRAATTLDEVLSLRSENAHLRAELHLASGLALAHGGEVERLSARLHEIEAQSIATTEPDYVAVPAKLIYERR